MKLLTKETRWNGGETVVALGMFDGVHEGHAQLIRRANHLAALYDLSSVVLTYDAHPLSVLAPEKAPRALSTRAEKVAQIARLRADALVLRPFTAAYAALEPEAFVRQLTDTLHPRHIVIGFNYSFGARGRGTPQLLRELGEKYGFETHIVDAVRVAGDTVSSTRVRAALEAGDVALCTALLGRYYTVSGEIMHGKQLGRTLGFPTANLDWPGMKALPPRGVYAAYAWIEGERYGAALNIGRHPTAPEGAPTLEAHLLDCHQELYGKHMRLELVAFLRGEQKFDSLDALKAQITRDAQNARARLAQEGAHGAE